MWDTILFALTDIHEPMTMVWDTTVLPHKNSQVQINSKLNEKNSHEKIREEEVPEDLC